MTSGTGRKPTAQAEGLTVPMLIGGRWRDGAAFQDVKDPYRGLTGDKAPVSTERDCDDALAAAHGARKQMAAMPGYERAALLRRAADLLTARVDDVAQTMSRESGKALNDSLIETRRSADILRLCAEEAIRIQGEHVPMDGSPMGAGKIAMLMRMPVGVVAAITPFNGPVSLAAHKLGPALAAGNSIVLKPSPKAPVCVHKLVAALVDAGAPAGSVNTVYGDLVAPQLVSDPRVDFVSFTGSIRVGKLIRHSVGMKRVALELGGVGPTFVHHDADLAAAAKACARNGMLLAGQSCVSVQNVFVHRKVFEPFVEAVCREVDGIRFGDPLDSGVDVGTLIDAEAAERVERTVSRAVDAGATALRSSRRQGALLGATVLVDVRPEMEVVRDEIFGPVMTLQPYDQIEPLFESISASPYGLQCGIFTNSLDLALSAIRNVRTGGVIVNGTSRWRNDQIPYGGVKDSGIGREGPKWSIRDMTEERFFVLN
jgi:acyl-CoA reductase-like NAD-dependent aldehyde dehydrogenase